MTPRTRFAVLLVAVLALLGVACGSDSPKEAATTTTTSTTEAAPSTTTAAATLEVLVTNDDGFDAAGIDAVVEALAAEPGIHLTVVAPATNQSGTGDKTTDGALVHRDVKTASGHDAVAVEGHPADAVIVALDQLGVQPDLVVSGTNIGQNIGPLTKISGTVGAALTAARRGIPALAASTGLGDNADYPATATLVVDWVREHRAALLAKTAPVQVESLNVPTCPTGKVRGLLKDIHLATDFNGRKANEVNCESTVRRFEDDVDGFINGYATLSVVPLS